MLCRARPVFRTSVASRRLVRALGSAKSGSGGPNTKSVHAGTVKDDLTGSVVSPAFWGTATSYSNASDVRYPRYFNIPNADAVAHKVASLENAEAGVCFGSGMAAISTAVLAVLGKPGAHAVFSSDLYGGTLKLAQKDLARFGFDATLVKGNNPADFDKAIKPNTKLVYIETPSNPVLAVLSLEAIGKLKKKHPSVALLIDSTFATPINQKPIDFGFDLVLHSATKYLNGHSDLCAGVAVGKKELVEKTRDLALSLGGSINTQSLVFLERGLKTLGVRVKQQNANAQALADALAKHPKVKRVFYPGLKTHPGHDIAKAQMSGFGGMVAFETHSEDPAKLKRFRDSLQVCTVAVSLGGVETTLCLPCETSHAYQSKAERLALGVTDSLMRVSVGIEDAEDIIADFVNALDNMG